MYTRNGSLCGRCPGDTGDTGSGSDDTQSIDEESSDFGPESGDVQGGAGGHGLQVLLSSDEGSIDSNARSTCDSSRLESKWIESSRRSNVQFASKLLVFVNICQYVYFFAGLIAANFDCIIYPFFTGWLEWLIPCFFVSTVGFGVCMYYPRIEIYMPSLLLWFFIAIVAFICWPDGPESFHCGPWNLSAWTESFSDPGDVNTRGYDTLQGNMVLILLTPLLVPRTRLMHPIVWGWMGIFYMYSALKLGFFNLNVLVAVLFIGVINVIAVNSKRSMESALKTQFLLDLKHKELSINLFRILRYMVPIFVVVPMLQKPGQIIGDHVERVSILFIMVEEFDRIARELSPEDLLMFLNEYFTDFDGLCAKHDVTKIETVGAEYVCAVGVVPDDRAEDAAKGHEANLMRLVLLAREVLDMQHARQVSFRMGIHTGPVIAGVVGQKLPRFRLFGDTVNTAARMMQKGYPGEVQFGQATRDWLPASVQVHFQGPVEMKGKGQVMTYLLHHRHCRHAHSLPPVRSLGRGSSGESLPGDHANGERLRGESFQSSVGAEERQQFSRRLSGAALQCVRTMSRVGTHATLQAWRFDSVLKALRFTEDMGRPKQNKCSIFYRWPQFSAEEEEGFLQWHHKEYMCLDLGKKLGKQALSLFVLSIVEVPYLLSTQEAFHRADTFIEVWTGLHTYLWTRMVCLAIVLAMLPAAGCMPRVLAWRRVSQGFMLVATCCMSVFLFLSYNSLPLMRIPSDDEDCVIRQFTVCGVKRNVDLLVFFPVYILVTNSFPFRFVQSLAFVAVAMFIIWLENFCIINPIFHSFVFRMVFLIRATVTPFESYLNERHSRERYQAVQTVDSMRHRINGILETLMPPLVLHDLRMHPGSAAPQHEYLAATIAQSDLCGFTELASTRLPEEVVEFISELFGLFDVLTDTYEVYKVETVGDAYIAGQAERPLTTRNSPATVVRFALEVVAATRAWSQGRGEAVSCRVGVHTGKCVGGVVGNDMQRYHLFGELMSSLEVLESTALAGRVQISQACKIAVDQEADRGSRLIMHPRDGTCLVTSKGEAHSFEEVGGRTYLVNAAQTVEEVAGNHDLP